MENFQLRLELYENTFLWMQGDFKWHFPVLNLPNKETLLSWFVISEKENPPKLGHKE